MAENKRRLFIYGVNEDVHNSDLWAKFGEQGWVKDTYNTGKGYAFVTFTHHSSAVRAIQAFHGKILFGKRVKVEFANPRAGDDEDEDDDDDDDGDDDDDEDSENGEDDESGDNSEDGENCEREDDSENEDWNEIIHMLNDIGGRMERLDTTEVRWNGYLVRRDE